MDYKKINKIEVDGNGNIVLQDINNITITINSNDTEAMLELVKTISEQQTFELKELLGKQHQNILEGIGKIQEQLDKQQLEEKAEITNPDIDEFLKELNQMKIKGTKENLLTNYKLLREYEQLLILEDSPKRKMKYQYEIDGIKERIKEEENEIKTLANI